MAPTPKRTQKYLSVLQNFYYFCDSQTVQVNAVTEKVNSLVARKKELDQKMEEFKTKINAKKMQALEDREEEADLQRMINEVNEDLENNLLPQREAITEESAGVKKQLADVTARVTDLKENVAKVEAEKDRLQVNYPALASPKYTIMLLTCCQYSGPSRWSCCDREADERVARRTGGAE